MMDDESDMLNLGGTIPKNVQKAVSTLKSIANFPDFTDEQEEIIQRIIDAFRRGDIPAKDTQKINQVVTTEKDPIMLFKKIYEIVDEKYLFGRQQTEILTSRQRQIILSCSLKGVDNQ